MMFNYTLNNSRRFGYSSTPFTISRYFSLLTPIVKANYTSILSDRSLTSMTAYEIGIEEFVFVDTTQSYDPDNLATDIGRLYTCHPNISVDWCNSIQNAPAFTISKAQRVSWGLNSIGSKFWIAVQLVASGRNSSNVIIRLNVTD
jgi:hypothetical protein